MRKQFSATDQCDKYFSVASLQTTILSLRLHHKEKKIEAWISKASVSISINEGVGQAPVGLGISFIQPSLCNPMFRISWTTRRRFRSKTRDSHSIPSGNIRGERLKRSTAALSQVSTQLEIYRENRGDTTLVNRAVHCVRNSSSPIAKLAGLSLCLCTPPPSGGRSLGFCYCGFKRVLGLFLDVSETKQVSFWQSLYVMARGGTFCTEVIVQILGWKYSGKSKSTETTPLSQSKYRSWNALK